LGTAVKAHKKTPPQIGRETKGRKKEKDKKNRLPN
jgi:hypothetical protein